MEQIKKIIVLSRQWAKKYKCDKPWAAISVSTASGDFPELSSDNRLGLLRLQFWDISNPSQRQLEAEDPKLFSRDQAKQVIDFVNQHWDSIDTLLVHCEAGLSRSPAIAAAIISIKYGEGADEEWFYKFNPNYHVYQSIINEHYGVESMAAAIAKRILEQKAYDEVLDEPWDVGR